MSAVYLDLLHNYQSVISEPPDSFLLYCDCQRPQALMVALCHAQGFGHGRVTLVGDAVHMGPPNGLGLNLALEDAAVLGHHLRLSGLTPDALRR